MRMARVLLLGTFFLVVPVALQAQVEESWRGAVGGQLLFAFPVGEFEENVDFGFGLGVHGRIELDPSGLFSLRGDLGFINYGNETIRICVTQPCRVTGDLTTSNNIFLLGVGPELGLGSGPVRVYGNVGIGFSYFATTSSVSGNNNFGDPFAEDTNFDDITFAWTAGSGIEVRIWSGRVPVSLDLGARYHGNGEARYLRRGDIEDEPDGSVTLHPRQSETNLWTMSLGVSVGLPAQAEAGR